MISTIATICIVLISIVLIIHGFSSPKKSEDLPTGFYYCGENDYVTPLENIDFERLAENIESKKKPNLHYHEMASILIDIGYDTNLDHTLKVIQVLKDIGYAKVIKTPA